MKVATSSRRTLLIALFVALVACNRRKPVIEGAQDLKTFEGRLKTVSEEQSTELAEAYRRGAIPHWTIAIIGDGIAAAAAAKNMDTPVRVYGAQSFWNNLQGLPEVWQTDLADAFTNAHLTDPKHFDHVNKGERIAREAVIAANLEGLLDAKAAYLQTSPVEVLPEAGEWKVVDKDGHAEIVTEALIIATGLLRPLRITDAIPDLNTDKVRRELSEAGKIMTGDEYLAMRNPPCHKVVGIVGAGGSSGDSIIHAIEEGGAEEVVVWGDVPLPLESTNAYRELVTTYGAKICRVPGQATSVGYNGDRIEINGSSTPPCIREDKSSSTARPIELLIESIGRYQGDPPPIVASAAGGLTITYHPVIENEKLIAVRVSFGDANQWKPMYLIGAAATWIPSGVAISAKEWTAYKDALAETVKAVNPGSDLENGPPGFAVAAFMGSHLAKDCFPHGDLVNKPPCQ